MEILGIGFSELLFILIIAIIVLGPKDMQKAGRTVGRWLAQLVRSDGWKALQRASQEIRKLPTNLMREANLEDLDLQNMNSEIRNAIDPRYPPAASPSSRQPRPPSKTGPTPEPGPDSSMDPKSGTEQDE